MNATETVPAPAPPYPPLDASPAALRLSLIDLRTWALQVRDPLNVLAGREAVPRPAPLPSGGTTRYESRPVPDLFRHFGAVRKLRESWDHLTRTYAAKWDDPACVRDRVALAVLAVHLVDEALLPRTHLFAAAPRQAEVVRRLIDHLLDGVDAFLEPYHGPEIEVPGDSGAGAGLAAPA